MTTDDVAEKVPGRKARGLWTGIAAAVAVVVLVAVALVAGQHYYTRLGDGLGEATQASTHAAIGGPFTLIDQDGRTVTDESFRGRYMLIYFGYTFCPDVCPTSLIRNTEALDLIGDKAANVVPILITVDPERDTPAHLKEYVKFFADNMVGLTGTPDQVAAAAKAYRVYYAKVDDKDGDAATYLMDHSALSYLMGPDGRFVQFFRHELDAAEVADRLRKLL